MWISSWHSGWQGLQRGHRCWAVSGSAPKSLGDGTLGSPIVAQSQRNPPMRHALYGHLHTSTPTHVHSSLDYPIPSSSQSRDEDSRSCSRRATCCPSCRAPANPRWRWQGHDPANPQVRSFAHACSALLCPLLLPPLLLQLRSSLRGHSFLDLASHIHLLPALSSPSQAWLHSLFHLCFLSSG